MALHDLIERITVRLSARVFRRSRSRQLAAVQGFQATEADGVWHLLRAFASTDDPKLRAILFTHMLEEDSHADAFVRVYEQDGGVFVPTFYERKDLFDPATPTWQRLAYVHVGEVDATERFGLLRDALPDGALKAALTSIVQDEEGHVDLTHDLLLQMNATEPEIRAAYRRVRRRRLWEHWLRLGKRTVNTVAELLLSLIYFALGPFFYRPARNKLDERIVEYDNNVLKQA